MAYNYGKSLTLCWYCRRSYLDGCSWATDLEPVQGWDADLCKLGRDMESYNVKGCPMFWPDVGKSDRRLYRTKPIANNSGAQEVAGQIVKQACVDFVAAYKAIKDPSLKQKLKTEYARYVEKRKREIANSQRMHQYINSNDIKTFEEFAKIRTGEWRKTIIECEQFFCSHYFGLISNMDGRQLLRRLKQTVMSRIQT